MANATLVFDEQVCDEIEKSIKQLEQRTSAELICAVATESGRYDRAEAVGGFFIGLLSLGLLHVFYTIIYTESGAWTEEVFVPFGLECIALTAGFILGNILFSHVHSLRQIFASGKEMIRETSRAANLVFAAEGLRRTRDRGGLLIYVSLFERQVRILADDQIMEKLGQEFLDNVRDTATYELKEGYYSRAFTMAIEQAADQLEKELPVEPDDVNELPDRFLVFHPRA